MKSSKSTRGVLWEEAPDIKKEIENLVIHLDFNNVRVPRVFCFRSFGSSSRARARIWSLPRIWQKALETAPAYCLEVLSEKFDHLPKDQRTQILIHELLHIPQNFSGSLLPHYRRRAKLPQDFFKILLKKGIKL